MRHALTRSIFAQWAALRGDRRAPLRRDIDPKDFARGLASLGLLERSGRDGATLRLAGTGICSLFGRELRTESFGGLWSQGAQMSVQTAMQRVLSLGQPILIEAYGDTASGRTMPLEILLMPLANEQGQLAQVLIFVQPLEATTSLLGEPLKRLRFIAMHQADNGQVSEPVQTGQDGPARPVTRGHLRLVVSRDISTMPRMAQPTPARWQGALQSL